MNKEMINIKDLCRFSNIEITFVRELHQYGLIEIIIEKEEEYLDEEKVLLLERYHTWHFDLDLNIPGIDVTQHLLDKIDELKTEVKKLKRLNTK